jgi:hypothetical protein
LQQIVLRSELTPRFCVGQISSGDTRQKLAAIITGIQHDIRQSKQDLPVVKNIKRVKVWLKSKHQRAKIAYFDDY